jgi:hypothetical protein
VDPSVIQWDERQLGSLRRYRGRHLNVSHDHAFRAKYHLPVFEREARGANAKFFVEWWITGREGTFPSGEGSIRDPRQYETRVHFSNSNRFLAGLLTAIGYIRRREDKDDGLTDEPLRLIPDLGASSLANEVIVETVLPRGPISKEGRERAMMDATSVPEYLHTLI